MGHVKHVSPESRRAHKISMLWRSVLQAVGAQSGERTNPRPPRLLCEEGPEKWVRGMFKDNGGVKFSAGPSLVTRRFCDEKVQGHFG